MKRRPKPDHLRLPLLLLHTSRASVFPLAARDNRRHSRSPIARLLTVPLPKPPTDLQQPKWQPAVPSAFGVANRAGVGSAIQAFGSGSGCRPETLHVTDHDVPLVTDQRKRRLMLDCSRVAKCPTIGATILDIARPLGERCSTSRRAKGSVFRSLKPTIMTRRQTNGTDGSHS